MQELLKEVYGHLFEEALLKEIQDIGVLKEIAEGQSIIEIGSYVKSMPLLLSGAVKVLRQDGEGEELILYFLEKGDTCAMTLSCCKGQTKSEIKAIAETQTLLLMIPIQKMEDWTAKYKSWRNFVFNSYHTRLNELVETIDSIAFLNMDERLWKYLQEKERVMNDSILYTTHQQIAYDLHTSRVVISRLLKTIEKRGKVKLNRNSIEIFSSDSV